MKKIIFFSLLVLIFLLSNMCRSDSKTFSKVTFEGFVYDSLGGAPSVGIPVVLRACKGNSQDDQCDSYDVGQTTTDATGHFHIHENAARSNRYEVSINNIDCGGLDYGDGSDWLKKNFSTVYLNKIP